MSQTQTADRAAAETTDAAPEDVGPQDMARLAAAVAGIADIVPRAPEGILAPRLRSPFFAASVALAVAAHVAGLAAYVAWRLDKGLGGLHANGAGVNIVEVDIIDGEDAVLKGGRTEEARPGEPAPLARAAVEQAASAAQPEAVAERTRTDESSPPQATQSATVLTIEATDASDALTQVPPPPVTVDTTAPPLIEARAPDRAEAEPPEPVSVEAARAAIPSEAAPELQASQASQGGDGGQAQAITESSGNGGTPAATAGQIKTYHARLGAHIKSHRPVSRGRGGKVIVTFRLGPDGVLQAANVVQSSGNALLEERTLAALQKASPYPRPPAGMRGKQLEFTVPFTFHQ